MKNLFKTGILVLGIMISISSCSSCGNKDKNAQGTAIDTPKSGIDTAKKGVDTAKKAGVDTIKKDTVKK